MTATENLAYWVRYYRMKADLTQTELAFKINARRTTLVNWEGLRSPISTEYAEAIALAVGVHISELYKDKPNDT